MKKYSRSYLLKISKQIYKYEIEYIYLKFLICNQKYQGLKIIVLLLLLLKRYKRKKVRNYFQNRCLITYNKRSVTKKYQLTRMKLKEFGLAGIIPGLRKSSW